MSMDATDHLVEALCELWSIERDPRATRFEREAAKRMARRLCREKDHPVPTWAFSGATEDA